MREPARFDSFSASDSWLRRIQDNFRQLFVRSIGAPKSANGAPIHLLTMQGERPARSQTASLVVHALVIAALLTAAKTGLPDKPRGSLLPVPLSPLFAPTRPRVVEEPSLGRKGGGGEDNPEPPRRGFLPLHSVIQLAPPRLPDQQPHSLPVTVTIFDPTAPNVAPISNLGLPQGVVDTNSGGPGHRGIGSGDDGGVGDRRGTGDGEADDAGPYAPRLSLPTCLYCPIPVYTDEARHVKVQGTVTLRVKVGTDGRARDIRVLRGIGYGLEERAIETVRTWKFKPARDASGHEVAAWITIEAVFHLF